LLIAGQDAVFCKLQVGISLGLYQDRRAEKGAGAGWPPLTVETAHATATV